MKVATFNVNGINGRLPVLLRWLQLCKPDVVCLQELKAPQDKFPLAEIEKAGYRAIWHGQKSWNGVAILARDGTPIVVTKTPGSASLYVPAAELDDDKKTPMRRAGDVTVPVTNTSSAR